MHKWQYNWFILRQKLTNVLRCNIGLANIFRKLFMKKEEDVIGYFDSFLYFS